MIQSRISTAFFFLSDRESQLINWPFIPPQVHPKYAMIPFKPFSNRINVPFLESVKRQIQVHKSFIFRESSSPLISWLIWFKGTKTIKRGVKDS